MPDNKLINTQQNNIENTEQQTNNEENLNTPVRAQISEDNIQDSGKDDSEVLIENIQNAKLELLRDIYEILGYNLGDTEANIDIRNYLISEPIAIGQSTEAGMFGVDLSNYVGGIISVENLLRIFPNAKKDYAIAALAALEKYGSALGLSDKGKLMVLAQFAVESGSFYYTAEIGQGRGKKYGVPTGPYNKVYYGRGPIQITWESNYKKITQEIFPQMGINVDIWANPELCEQNLLIGCAASLAWFGLPGNGRRAVECANAGDVDGLSKAINGGWNGIAKRREYTQKIFNNI